MTVEEILAQMQAVIDAASGRSLTDEEATRYEELEGQLQRAQKTEEVQKRQKAYQTPVTAPLLTTGQSASSDSTLERAFSHYLRTGKENSDIVELRAQSVGTATAGGYTVPDGFRTKLVERMKAFGGIAGAAEEVTTETGQPLEWPTLDDTSNVGAIVAENAAPAGGADLVFGTATLAAYKYDAVGAGGLPLKVSFELLQDAAFDVEALVARKLGERIYRAQAQHLVTGTGSSQPKGIITGLTPVQAGQNTGLKYDDLINYIHSVDPAYREMGNCKWAFNDAALATIRKLKDAAGDPLWKEATENAGNGPASGTLLGYPVVIDQGFANYTPASATVIWGAFGDFREGFVVRRIKDVQVLVNPYSSMASGQVEFMAWARMDATQQNTNAYVALTGKV